MFKKYVFILVMYFLIFISGNIMADNLSIKNNIRTIKLIDTYVELVDYNFIECRNILTDVISDENYKTLY